MHPLIPDHLTIWRNGAWWVAPLGTPIPSVGQTLSSTWVRAKSLHDDNPDANPEPANTMTVTVYYLIDNTMAIDTHTTTDTHPNLKLFPDGRAYIKTSTYHYYYRNCQLIRVENPGTNTLR